MTHEVKVALYAGVLPGVIAGVLLLIAHVLHVRHRRRRAASPHAEALRAAGPGRWALPAALLAAAPIANAAVFTGLPKVWPVSATERWAHAAALFAVLGLVESLVRLPREAVFVARAGAIAGASWVLGGSYVGGAVDLPTFVGFTGMAAVLGAAAIALAEQGARTLGSRASACLLVVWAVALLPLLFFAGSANGAQTGGPLLVAFTIATAFFAVLNPALELTRGAMTAFMGVSISLALAPGWQNDAPPVPVLVLAALAPAGLCAAGLAGLGAGPEGRGRWRQIAGAAGLIGLALAVAGAQVGLSAAAEDARQTDDAW
jgi:hypothetical protein